MCKGTESFSTITSAGSSLCGPNPKRKCLVIGCPSGVQITISHKNPPVLGQGLTWNNAVEPIILRETDVGDWIRQSIYAIVSVASQVIGYLEVTWEENEQ
jgi:hypothetical protein